MSIAKDCTIEVSQVGNGFIVRLSPTNWFTDQDRSGVRWVGAQSDHLVFRTMAELQSFLALHFTWRAVVDRNDKASKLPEVPPALPAKKAA